MLANLDDSVGVITEKVRSEGLEKDTLIYFLSDNGGPTRELTSSNLPLRGEKSDMYEGGIRVPFIVRWPGKLPAGTTYDRPVISTDIFATVLAAAGQPVASELKLDSVDIVPYLTGEKKGDPHGSLFWRQGPRAALRKKDMKVVRQTDMAWELYDLSKDISESSNLACTEPILLKELVADWQQVNAEMVDAAFQP